MCGFMILFHIFTTQTVEEELINLLSKPDEFADFTFLGFLTTQNGNVVAITVFLGWIKIFKYLTFNKTMTQLTKTLSRVIHFRNRNLSILLLIRIFQIHIELMA